MRAAPALMHRRKLPAEVCRVADASIHAKSAVRRHHVRRVARNEHTALPIAVRYHSPAHPMADRENFEVEIAPGGASHFGGSIDVERLVLVLTMNHQPPALAVGRR